MKTINVPFNNLHLQYMSIKEEIDISINEVIKNSSFIRGPFVEKFEKEFAQILGIKHCISCANGTDALYIAIKSFQIRPGDEIIVPANSWISSSSAITQAGANVVFCDVNPLTNNIEPDEIRRKITSRTVGIIAVHLFGHPADMASICSIANENKLWIIEDCAQSHLAELQGKMTGSFGHAATFSFYPGKNLGAFGDAGAIVTNEIKRAEYMAMFARHGGSVKGEHLFEGINSRMDGLQAAILSCKLRYLKEWTETRIKIAELYSSELSSIDQIELPITLAENKHVFHLFVIKTENRDALRKHLNLNSIQTNIHYPTASPFLQAYKYLNYKFEDFPVSYANQNRILTLPLYPELRAGQIEAVISGIRSFFK